VQQLIQHKQLAELLASNSQHTIHHNRLLMAQQDEEGRLLRDKYRQIEALYRFQNNRANALESKLDECIREKLQLQQESRRMKHEAARWEHSRPAADSRRTQAAASGRVDSRRVKEEQPWLSEAVYGDDEEPMVAAEDDHYPLSPAAVAPAPPIRVGRHSERARVDLTPAASSAHYHSHSATSHSPAASGWSASIATAAPPLRPHSDPRSFVHGGPDSRPSFTSTARKYSTGHA